MFLRLADILLTLLHLAIISFNLFGWIWKRTRRLHLVCVLLTAACWFILGIWYGWGYCPVTDLEWHIKEKLGEHNLPDSFIKYFADKISGTSVSTSLVDTVTAVAFFTAAALSVYVNFFRQTRRRNPRIE
ncbi:MAG: DUF2784 domain-containing protein [Bacteroidetes bacterium]|nr:DUF2784 domain-containing protein [Bacteroidota bacterium]